MNWSVVLQLLGAALGAAGLREIVTALAGRRGRHVDAADKLNRATLEYAQRLNDDAATAHVEAQ